MSLLSAITLLPLLFAVIVMCLPKTWVRPIALVLALFEFGLSLSILGHFDKTSAMLQLSENVPWIPEFGVSYSIGVDGLSLWLVLLTTFLTPLVVLGSWVSIEKSIKG